MSAPDLDAIIARAGATTPGPWYACQADTVWRMFGEDHVFVYSRNGHAADGFGIVALTGIDGQHLTSRADAEFIAHAHGDVLALVAEVRRLRAELAEVRDRLRFYADDTEAETISGMSPAQVRDNLQYAVRSLYERVAGIAGVRPAEH